MSKGMQVSLIHTYSISATAVQLTFGVLSLALLSGHQSIGRALKSKSMNQSLIDHGCVPRKANTAATVFPFPPCSP